MLSCFQGHTKKEIPASDREIPRRTVVQSFPYLKRIYHKIPQHIHGLGIGLLIGSNCPKALEPKDFIVSEHGGPYAMKTFAGWTVVGPLKAVQNHTQLSCSRIYVKEVNSGTIADHHFMFHSQVKEVLTPTSVNKMMELEFHERSNDNCLGYSVEDHRFLEIMNKECQRVDGHYQLPLPLRDQDAYIPNNREQVYNRMKWLKKKLLMNKKLYLDYCEFMTDILRKEYARKVPEARTVPLGKLWYIPHHAVYHAKKPEKIRVVYNCSAKFHGKSLNDQLIQGPDLTSTLIGVLTRFRQKPIAFTADIEAMFYQVRIPDSQRDLLRFLWWPDGDLMKDVEDYQMNVHPF